MQIVQYKTRQLLFIVIKPAEEHQVGLIKTSQNNCNWFASFIADSATNR